VTSFWPLTLAQSAQSRLRRESAMTDSAVAGVAGTGHVAVPAVLVRAFGVDGEVVSLEGDQEQGFGVRKLFRFAEIVRLTGSFLGVKPVEPCRLSLALFLAYYQKGRGVP